MLREPREEGLDEWHSISKKKRSKGFANWGRVCDHTAVKSWYFQNRPFLVFCIPHMKSSFLEEHVPSCLFPKTPLHLASSAPAQYWMKLTSLGNCFLFFSGQAGSSWSTYRAPILCHNYNDLSLKFYIYYYLIVFLYRPQTT